ncbi:hypothetical protein LTR70_002210 [Exophiala xenobiotica]|uniref:Protein NO VEIN C-terminal domain-containing protein n=1 Tax=Lithohypha guttulata TaxID=1690604 RepID=A0ABR0JYU0_9EURO|nr:hypothetical protein LTR24_008863 [Lithohypha guttulata]KAK5326210.1 hypothetical protein LTR70_002210 [Exophiala xenobiotica]
MGKLRLKQRRKITEGDRQRAAELIEEIRQENGNFDTLFAHLDAGSGDVRKLQKAMRSLKQKANNSIALLSHDIYSESGGYINELIQNADDCEYSVACDEGDVPTLQFHLTDNCLTISSNEDGFSKANVRSICDMGNSSKISGKHTGQKGIGFKSVFTVAWKVHVRSDPYSFSFTPEQVGSNRGLSLVMPSNEESPELTDEQGTRLILYLNSQHREQRMSELRGLDSYVLLFLKSIRKLVIHIETRESTRETLYVRQDDGVSRKITKTTTRKGSTQSVVRRYIIKSRNVRDLPTQADGPQASTGCVELAFRIGSDGKPSTSPYQHRAYACLPVEMYKFQFDVNADFHVAANRESLKDTRRNRRLRSEVAQAFCEQVSYFARGPDLRYSWLHYYSSRFQAKEFWVELQEAITDLLWDVPLFWPRSKERLLRAREIYHLPCCYCHDEGDPLFDDVPEQYLAKEYSDHLSAKLVSLGVEDLPVEIFLKHVACDLDMEDSNIKAYCTTKDNDKDSWHEKVTQILIQELQGKSATRKDTIKELKFIPLTNGRWVPYAEGVLFDTSLAESAAPKDVKLKIISNSALPMKVWKPIFQQLGVSSTQPSNIVSKIEEMHLAWGNDRAKITQSRSLDHLQYIFMNGAKNQMLSQHFRLLNHSGDMRARLSDTVRRFYFKDDDNELGCFALLESCDSPDVQFLHPRVVDLVPHSESNCHGVTWTEWLRNNVGVRSAPVILVQPANQPPQLSAEFGHMKKRHPEKIARLLWQHRSTYRRELKGLSPDAAMLIRNIEIPTAGGLECPISESYLPHQDLVHACHNLGIQGPLLSEIQDLLESPSSEKEATDLLIKRFGVREKVDVDFCVKALMELKSSGNPAEIERKSVKAIYGQLLRSCEGELQDPESRSKLTEEFEKYSLIFYHDSERQTQQWLPLSKCLWDPDDGLFTGMISIRSQYMDLEELFQTYLNIDKPSLYMYVRTLEGRLGNDSKENITTIEQIIIKISSAIDDDQVRESISDQLSESDDEESSVSDANSSLGNNDDEGSESDADSASASNTEEDSESDNDSTSANDTDGESESDFDDDKAFARLARRDFKFLPVREPDGTYRLASIRAAFVIPDSYELRDDFKGLVPMLDLTLDQIHACSRLIENLGLSSKLLSQLGKYEPDVINDCEDQDQTQIFRRKAAAFCGCLKRFASMTSQQLQQHHDRLSKVKVSQCEEVLKRFCLEFKSKSYTGAWKPAWLQIESAEDSDHIFIPRNLEQREYCTLAKLPQAMMEFLGIDNPEARSVITMIVGASTDARAKILMENANIPLWPPQDSHDESEEVDEQSLSEQELSNDASIGNQVEDLSLLSEISTSAGWKGSGQSPMRTRVYEGNRRDQAYIDILGHVVQEAKTTVFPDNGSISLSKGNGHGASVRFQDIFKKEHWADDERHIKVGAAGELFVFEILKQVLEEDHSFGLQNWTSRIRHHVSGLYADIDKWEGDRETTDFQYNDRLGILTNLLLGKNYLQIESVEKYPTYIVEVKAGVGKCESSFHVSDKQYKLMKGKTILEEEEVTQIYILCRVFHIDHARIGLRVFVDPWRARFSSLRFEPSKWVVQVTGS